MYTAIELDCTLKECLIRHPNNYLDEAKKIAKIESMGGSLLACWIQHDQDVGRIVPTDVSQCTLVYSSVPQCITNCDSQCIKKCIIMRSFHQHCEIMLVAGERLQVETKVSNFRRFISFISRRLIEVRIGTLIETLIGTHMRTHMGTLIGTVIEYVRSDNVTLSLSKQRAWQRSC